LCFSFPLASGNKVSEWMKGKANAIDCCSKKNSRFGKGLVRASSIRTILASELLWIALKR